MTRTRRPETGLTDDSVTCRLCGRSFRAITFPHLSRIHGWDSHHPVKEYQARFRLKRSECLDTGRKRRVHRRDFLARTGHLLNRTDVLRRIKWRRTRGLALNHALLHEKDQQLVRAGKKHFGSWDSALSAAGILPEGVRLQRRWTRQAILDKLRGFGRFVGSHRVSREDTGFAQVVVREFGSWEEAYRQAGIKYTPWACQTKWTRDKILSTIQSRARQHLSLGYDAIPSELPGVYAAAYREFGTWRKAVSAAKCTWALPKGPKKWTRKELALTLRRIHKEKGRTTEDELRRHKRKGYENLMTAIVRFYGRLLPAKAAAGVPLTKRRLPGAWSKEKIIRTIRRRLELGKSLRPHTIAEDQAGLYGAAYREFGSWRAAQVAAGHEPGKPQKASKWDRERLKQAIVRLDEAGYFKTHGPGLHGRGDLISGIRRHFGACPSQVVPQILREENRAIE